MSQWSSSSFEFLYNAILDTSRERQMDALRTLTPGSLLNLLNHSKKSDSSRQAVESSKVIFTDGMEYQLNKSFIEDTIRTANILNVDEIITAEVLFYAMNSNVNIGVNPVETAIISWYDRNTFIFQILSYYLNASDDSHFDSPKQYVINLIKEKPKFSQDIVSSMKSIGVELEEIKKEVERFKVLGEYDIENSHMKNISYRRDVLYRQHQLLGEILHGYFINFITAIPFDEFNSILDHIQTFDPSDIFSLSYFPALMAYVTSIDKMSDTNVDKLHKEFILNIDNIEKLADFPLKSIIILAFLTSFIQWCKFSTSRSEKYQFQSSVESPMEKVIAVGALEQFLSICADTSVIEITGEGKPYYNFRGFLQRHIPSYISLRCMDIDEKATNKLKRNLLALGAQTSAQIDEMKPLYSTVQEPRLNTHFIEFVVISLHNFVFDFVSSAAFMLTSLRDQEEDMLLSEENDIEGVAENADLERAYLGMFYLYSKRPELGASFWVNSESNYSNNVLYGFLQWGSKCNSPLIMASYSMLLSALSSDKCNAENVFTFLQSTNSDSMQMNGNNSISSMRYTSGLLLKYGSVSWSTIYSSLAYYNTQLKNINGSGPEQHSFTVVKKQTESTAELKAVVAELGEDSVIYLSSLFHILISVSKHSPKARKELLESDDGQLIGLLNVLLINVSENVIKGAVLKVLSFLIGPDSLYEINPITNEINNKFERDTREKIWKVLDSWLFYNTSLNLARDRLAKELTSYPLISGFANLLSALLSSYPGFNSISDISGQSITGNVFNSSIVSLYIEFLIKDVFPSIEYSDVDSVISEGEKKNLQIIVLRLISKLLQSFDPQFIEIFQAAGLKEIDKAVSFNISGGIVGFLQSHPGSATLKSLYQNSVYEAIFRIGNVGVDNLNQFVSNSIELELLLEALSVVELILQRDTFYVNDLVPVLRLKDNQFMDPAAVGSGTSGLRNFYDAFLLNLKFVGNLSLYISSSHTRISRTALNIFKYISSSKLFDSSTLYGFNNTSGSSKGKMLIMLETIDESQRVRESWIQQYESKMSYTDDDNDDENSSMGIKIAMLEFLVDDLRKKLEISNGSITFNSNPSIAHFLLGFDTRKLGLGSEDELGFVNSPRSLLKEIIVSLKDAILTLNSSNIQHANVRIAYLSMNILLILSKSKILGHSVITWLRGQNDLDLISQFLKNSGFVNALTIWSGQRFNENICIESDFAAQSDSMSTLTFFVNFRSSFFELLTEILNDALKYGDLNLIAYYVQLLTNSTGYGTDLNKLLEFLDVTSFQTKVSIGKVDSLFSNFDFKFIMANSKLQSTKTNGTYYDLSIIDKMVYLLAKDHPWNPRVNSMDKTTSISIGKERLKRLVLCSLNNDEFRWSFLEYLKSWSFLTQFVANRGYEYQDPSAKSNFILEVFQSVIPRIDQYLENNTTYAEILVSLCVNLLNVYIREKNNDLKNFKEIETRSTIDARRLLPLFQICIKGIISPSTTPSLRSDLYIIGEKYLGSTMINKNIIMSTDILIFMKSVDTKFFDMVFHDSIVGDSENKISSLLFVKSFLKCLGKLSTQDAKNTERTHQKGYDVEDGIQISEKFIFDIFCASNYIPTLIQQLQKTDKIFKNGWDIKATAEIRFELISYKLSIGFLTVLAQSRIGAQKLLQSNIFKVIRECEFLNIDIDFDWKFNTLGRTAMADSTDEDTLLMLEVLISVFQFITTVIITLGPGNETSAKEASITEKHFQRLIQSVFKKENLIDEKYSTNEVEKFHIKEIRKLTELFALINALS